MQGWLVGPTVGSISDVAIVQGANGYCPNEKETDIYVYGKYVRKIEVNYMYLLHVIIPHEKQE